ncbi:MAG: pilus assembly protein PilZ [Prochlorococcus sp.]
MSTRLTTSRAFWNLRAEQVMDRVFDLQEPPPTTPVKAAEIKAAEIRIEPSSTHSNPLNWRILGLTGLAATGLISSLWLARNWQVSSTQLSRERNLLLLERLRQLPPKANAVNDPDRLTSERPAPDSGSNSPLKDSRLPNSPIPDDGSGPQAVANQADQQPQTATTIELAALPPPDPALMQTLEPVTVPFPNASKAQPTSSNGTAAEALPILVGVVHAPGGDSSAIFQLQSSSTSATPGDSIGSSGWRLTSVTTDGAVIERQGEEKRLSVGGAF